MDDSDYYDSDDYDYDGMSEDDGILESPGPSAAQVGGPLSLAKERAFVELLFPAPRPPYVPLFTLLSPRTTLVSGPRALLLL